MTKYKVVVRPQARIVFTWPEARALIQQLLDAGLWYLELTTEESHDRKNFP